MELMKLLPFTSLPALLQNWFHRCCILLSVSPILGRATLEGPWWLSTDISIASCHWQCLFSIPFFPYLCPLRAVSNASFGASLSALSVRVSSWLHGRILLCLLTSYQQIVSSSIFNPASFSSGNFTGIALFNTVLFLLDDCVTSSLFIRWSKFAPITSSFYLTLPRTCFWALFFVHIFAQCRTVTTG